MCLSPLSRRVCALALPVMAAWHAAPLQAQSAPPTRPVVMMCEMIDESRLGWVPEFLILTRQENGRIEVFDAILQSLIGRPIEASVTADGARARSYGWALSGVRNQSGQWADRMDFRLHVRKSDGSAVLETTVQGYENTMRGQGRCISPQKR